MQDVSPKKKMSVALAILLGHLLVTIPIIVFMLGLPLVVLFVTLWIFQVKQFLLLVSGAAVLGFIMGWTWWSLLTPRWRNWSHQQGVPADKLQKWAVLTGLAWPKGWIFEKTEFKPDDR